MLKTLNSIIDDNLNQSGKKKHFIWNKFSPFLCKESETVLDSGFNDVESGFQVLDSGSFVWGVDSGCHEQKFSGFPYNVREFVQSCWRNSTLAVEISFMSTKGGVTRDDSQRRYLAQQRRDVVLNCYNIAPTLQGCVANRPVYTSP